MEKNQPIWIVVCSFKNELDGSNINRRIIVGVYTSEEEAEKVQLTYKPNFEIYENFVLEEKLNSQTGASGMIEFVADRIIRDFTEYGSQWPKEENEPWILRQAREYATKGR